MPGREKVTFEPNVPQTIALKYPVGKIVSGIYGEQVYYTLADERAMYLDLHVAQKINDLSLRAGEPIVITKKWSGSKKEPMTWSVERAQQQLPTPDPGNQLQQQLHDSITLARARKVGEQGDGTFAVPSTNGATALAPKKPAVSAAAVQQWQDALLLESCGLVDIFARAWEYARVTYSGQVKPEDVRGLVTTVYIQTRKGGAHAA